MEKYTMKIRLVEWMFLLVYVILFYFDFILVERLKIFFIILFVIWTYIVLYNFVSKRLFLFLKENLMVKYEEKGKKEEFLNFLMVIASLLIKIYVYKNVLLLLLIKLEMKFFFWFRRINLLFINYWWVRKIIYMCIFCLFMNPIKLVFMFFYKFLEKLKDKTLVELVFRRATGLIISVLLLTRVINYILLFLKNIFIYVGMDVSGIKFIIYLIIIEYIILVMISIFQVDIEESKYHFYNLLKVKSWLIANTNVLALIDLRLENTIFGKAVNNLMGFLLRNGRFIQLDDMELLNFVYREIGVNNMLPFLYYYYGKKGMDARLKQRIIADAHRMEDMLCEIKNKPILFLIWELYMEVKEDDIASLLYGLRKYKDDEEKLKEIKGLYLRLTPLMRYWMFKMWDIERYVGFKENGILLYPQYEERDGEIIYEYRIRLIDNNFFLFRTRDYEKGGVMSSDSVYSLNLCLRGNKEEFLDIEDNYDKYVEMYSKIDGKEIRELMDELASYVDKNEIFVVNEIVVPLNGEIKSEYEECFKMYLLIRQDMTNLIEGWRKEWEKEWEEGKRSYKWDDKKE